LIGGSLLFGGLVVAALGPIEMYCFYLFSEGGRFHYEGFGFGSFMFGNIASQILGYYLIAAALVPLGYGHLRLRRWARTLTVALLWFLLVLGVPLMILFLLVLVSSKELQPAMIVLVVLALVLSYLLLPWLLIRFYEGRNVRRSFEVHDKNTYWTEKRPMPILVLAALFLLFAVVLHIPILFNGLFPLFGAWLASLPGIVALTVTILTTGFVAVAILGQTNWAWWSAVVWLGLLTCSATFTLATSTYSELLALADFPSTEMAFLQGVPLRGPHLAAFVGLPLVITLGILLLSKGCFGTGAGQHVPTCE
jgi:hypothetical protein